MSLSNRSARRRGMLMGAAISSSRSKKQAAISATQQPASAQPSAPDNENPSHIEEIKQLAELHSKGILTDEEFASKKKQLLGL